MACTFFLSPDFIVAPGEPPGNHFFNPRRGEGVGGNDGRWQSYNYDELISCDKASLDIFRLKDESLEASDNLPDPDVIAQEIVDDLESALEQFREIATVKRSPRNLLYAAFPPF